MPIDTEPCTLTTPCTILGIESSCDETAAAIVSSDQTVHANIIASSAELHARHGGVVPEIAARQHLDVIRPVIEQALSEAGCSFDEIDGIAATGGPGLIGGVLVGTMSAKAIAAARGLPYFAVNHLEGHALTARLTDGLEFPYLLLLVSGGHTQLLCVRGPGLYSRYGTTMDDAAGEAFDKSAAVLGLGYPGGPAIEKAAIGGQSDAIQLPRPRRNTADCHFSFSGLKTAVATRWQAANDAYQTGKEDAPSVADFAASLQQAIADSLVARTKHALHRFYDETGRRQLVVAGGVAANQTVRQALHDLAAAEGFSLSTPPLSLCTDNGAMIAWVGCEYFQLNRTSPFTFAPRPRWPLDDDAPPPPGRGIRI